MFVGRARFRTARAGRRARVLSVTAGDRQAWLPVSRFLAPRAAPALPAARGPRRDRNRGGRE
ncbi:hypothetical protein GCM10023178_60810 [Actinomadura luteofluorescens]